MKRKKRNFDVTGIHQDVMNILRECERFEAATSELRNEPSLPHENFIQTTCSMCGRGRDAGPGKTLADGTSVDWTGDDYRR